MAGEYTGQDMREDKGAYEAKGLVDSVEKRLAEFAAKETLPISPKPDTNEVVSKADAQEDVQRRYINRETKQREVDDGQREDVSDSDARSDDADNNDGNNQEADDKTMEIPSSIYRALVHSDWKPEDISTFYEADPERAMKVFERIYKTTNSLSRQFAEIGRTRANSVAKAAANESQQKLKQDVPADFVDIKVLREMDPDNPLLPVIEGMNKALSESLGRKQNNVQESASSHIDTDSQVQSKMALATQVLTYLGAETMSQYKDFYGPAFDENRLPVFDNSSLTPGQVANRTRLIQMADEIWYGASEHGCNLSVHEALDMAHLLLTEPMRKQQIVSEVASSVKKRAKGITLRPSGKKGIELQTADGQKRKPSMQELETLTQHRLAKLRGRAV